MSRVEIENLAQGNRAFAVDLYQQLRKADDNLFFSPFSISVALAMTYAGARGETGAQMARVLHFAQTGSGLHSAFAELQAGLTQVQTKGGIQFKAANSLWPQEGYSFLDEFIALSEAYYGVSVTPVNYHEAEAARKTINQWVEARTENKITDLIPSGTFNTLTRLTLVNAIYFKGNWQDQFEAHATKQAAFWSADGQVQTAMMNRMGIYRYAETESLQALELPYKGNEFSMWILLPRQRDGLAQFEEQLTPDLIDRLPAMMSQKELGVSIPIFKIEAAFQLNGTLQTLGMTDAFDLNKANFAGMDGSETNLFISDAIHKAFIEVNEKGSEAAAATAIVMRFGAIEPDPLTVFQADHPFLFLIREKRTGSILFMGRLSQP